MSSIRHFLAFLGVVVAVACAPTETGGGPTTSPEEPPGATSSSVEMTTTTVVPSTGSAVRWEEGEWEAALIVVDDFYAALNDGDVAAALTLVSSRPHRYVESLELAIEGLNAQFEYSCNPGVDKGELSCVESVVDDLYGPAGITNATTVSYEYRNGRLAIGEWPRSFVCASEPTGDALDFLIDLRVWSAETHPELESFWVWGEPLDSPAAIPCTVYPFVDEYEASRISEVVPEFVTQSVNWPVEEA